MNFPRKKILILSLILFLILFFFAAFFYFKSLNKNNGQVAPSPTPPEIIISTPTPQSPYATDSALLQIRNDLKTQEKILNSFNWKVDRLLPPALDLKVQFDE